MNAKFGANLTPLAQKFLKEKCCAVCNTAISIPKFETMFSKIFSLKIRFCLPHGAIAAGVKDT
jgi:hypothetical protein